MVGNHVSMYSKITALELTMVYDNVFKIKYTFTNWPKSVIKGIIKFISMIILFPVYLCFAIPLIVLIFLFIYTINFIPIIRYLVEIVFMILDFIAALLMIVMNATELDDYGYSLQDFQNSYEV